jgi:hypothetical protein
MQRWHAMTAPASNTVRAVVVLVCAAFVLVACGASGVKRNYLLGSGPSACWDIDSECVRSAECCSMWCVNGSCTQREP